MTLPVLVTSAAEPHSFSEICETLVVNAHGCALRSTNKLDAGVPVHFRTNDGNWATAHIVDCKPMGDSGWVLGARLEKPTDWGLTTHPDDWTRLLEMPSPTKLQAVRKPAADLHAVIAELVEPLHAAVTEIRHKIERRDANRSSFDISLSYIPPEVQEKLAVRLKEELREEVLDKTRLQSEAVMEATKDAVGKRISEARSQFRTELSRELQKVEERAQGLSDEITTAVQQHFDSGEERLALKLAEANDRLERHGEEFFRTLQLRLAEEHGAYRREMQHIHSSAASEIADIQAEIGNLTNRLSALDASAGHLESGMEGRLSEVAGSIILGARTQLENALDVVLKDLGTRNAHELQGKLDEACRRLEAAQKGTEHSIHELVKTKVTDSLVTFGQTVEVLAQDAVLRWREGLANDLNSMSDILEKRPRVKSATQ
jgi:hypothetical protein